MHVCLNIHPLQNSELRLSFKSIGTKVCRKLFKNDTAATTCDNMRRKFG